MANYLDMGFEALATGLEMIETIIEAHQDLFGDGHQHTKSDHPSTFEASLYDNGQEEDN